MAIVRVQTPAIAEDAASNGSIAKAFSANTTTGNALIAIISWGTSTTISSVTDGTNNLSQAVTQLSTLFTQNVAIWYAVNITGLTTPTITVTFSANTPDKTLWIAEYAGMVTASPLDGTANTQDNVGPSVPDPGTISPTQDNDLVLCVSCANSSPYTPASGMTELFDSSATFSAANEEIQTTASSRTTFWTAPSAAWAACAAAFKAASGGETYLGLPIYLTRQYQQWITL